MPSNVSQQPKDNSAAALAFATMLSENLLKQKNQQPEQTGQSEEQLDLESLPETTESSIQEEPTEMLESEPAEQTEEPKEEQETEDEESSFDELKTMIKDGFESIKKWFKNKDEEQEKEPKD